MENGKEKDRVKASVRMRRVLALLCAVAGVVAGCAAVGLGWFSRALGSEDAFLRAADSVSADQQFRTELTDAVVEDVMSSEQVTSVLGNGHSTAWYGGLLNWAYSGGKSLLTSTVRSAVDSGDFAHLWSEVARSTYAADLGPDPQKVLTVDISPVYAEANARVKSAVGLDLGLDGGQHLIPLEQPAAGEEDGTAAGWLHRLQAAARYEPWWTAGAVLASVAAWILAPRHRWYLLAGTVALTGVLAWAGMTAGHQWLLDQAGAVTGTGGLVGDWLIRAVTADVPQWANASAGIGCGAGLVLLLVGLLGRGRRKARAAERREGRPRRTVY